MPNSQALVKEAKSINLSLHFLEQVIVSLRENMRTCNNNNNSNQQQHSSSGNASGGNSNSNSNDNRPASASSNSSRNNNNNPSNTNNNNTNNNSNSNSNQPFVPYRNSVLTNMLRDSLGGNCKSSFLLTISQERLHFEETVATCRFGQRCGEVKVKIRPNTEIGLTDQLKDLQQRIKMLEKKLLVTEEERNKVRELLVNEEKWRRQLTELRTLSTQEKAICKICVQELLTAAKESVIASSSTSITSSSAGGGGVNGGGGSMDLSTSEQIIIRSQDALYDAVEKMDKAVLVELSTALGGLVQSMYIEREMSKQEEMIKESKRQQKEMEEEQRQQEERTLLQLFLDGQATLNAVLAAAAASSASSPSSSSPSSSNSSLAPIPLKILDILQRGRYFYKHGRYGQPKLRFFSLENDLKTLGWYAIEHGTPMGTKTSVIELKLYEK